MNTKSNETLLTLLNNNDRTRIFAGLVKEFPDIISRLENLSLRTTVLAPCDEALRSHAETGELSTTSSTLESRRRFIDHLISPYPAPRDVLTHSTNIPLLYKPAQLNGSQLMRTRPVFDWQLGPTSSIGIDDGVIEDEFPAANGVIHFLSRVPRMPEPISTLLEHLPSKAFGILQRAIQLTGFDDELTDTRMRGCTFFAPTDAAFSSALGVHHLEDLDSIDMTKLRKLLRRHFSPNHTFYTNIYWRPIPPSDPRSSDEKKQQQQEEPPARPDDTCPFIVGSMTKKLPCATGDGEELSITVNRRGGLVELDVNGKGPVLSADLLAENGVVHVVGSFLWPLE